VERIPVGFFTQDPQVPGGIRAKGFLTGERHLSVKRFEGRITLAASWIPRFGSLLSYFVYFQIKIQFNPFAYPYSNTVRVENWKKRLFDRDTFDYRTDYQIGIPSPFKLSSKVCKVNYVQQTQFSRGILSSGKSTLLELVTTLYCGGCVLLHPLYQLCSSQ